MPVSATDNRNWTDQPAFLAGAASLCLCNTGDTLIQVMRSDAVFPGAAYYVTAGSLFGSRTIRVRDADDAFRAIETIGAVEEGQTIVAGRQRWTVIPNDQREECV